MTLVLREREAVSALGADGLWQSMLGPYSPVSERRVGLRGQSCRPVSPANDRGSPQAPSARGSVSDRRPRTDASGCATGGRSDYSLDGSERRRCQFGPNDPLLNKCLVKCRGHQLGLASVVFGAGRSTYRCGRQACCERQVHHPINAGQCRFFDRLRGGRLMQGRRGPTGHGGVSSTGGHPLPGVELRSRPLTCWRTGRAGCGPAAPTLPRSPKQTSAIDPSPGNGRPVVKTVAANAVTAVSGLLPESAAGPHRGVAPRRARGYRVGTLLPARLAPVGFAAVARDGVGEHDDSDCEKLCVGVVVRVSLADERCGQLADPLNVVHSAAAKPFACVCVCSQVLQPIVRVGLSRKPENDVPAARDFIGEIARSSDTRPALTHRPGELSSAADPVV